MKILKYPYKCFSHFWVRVLEKHCLMFFPRFWMKIHETCLFLKCFLLPLLGENPQIRKNTLFLFGNTVASGYRVLLGREWVTPGRLLRGVRSSAEAITFVWPRGRTSPTAGNCSDLEKFRRRTFHKWLGL